MIFFLLYALAARASESDKKFFNAVDDSEYCYLCTDEFLKEQMTKCIHNKFTHYLNCGDCANDENVLEMFEKTLKAKNEMDEGVNVCTITCPICNEPGRYCDNNLNVRNENAIIEMNQNINDLQHDHVYQQEDDQNDQYEMDLAEAMQRDREWCEEYQRRFGNYEEQMEKARRMSMDAFKEQRQQTDETDEQLRQAIEESKLQLIADQADHEQFDIRGRINNYENNLYGKNKQNLHIRSNNLNDCSLNASMLGKNVAIRKRDKSTFHVMMNSLWMAFIFTLWIAFMPGAKLKHTDDKMGYLLQQFSRTYLAFIGGSGLLYTIFSKERAWHNKHTIMDIFNCRQRDADAKRSLVFYLSSIFTTLSMVVSLLGWSERSALVVFTSWFTLLVGLSFFFGLLVQRCFKCCAESCGHQQRTSCVEFVNDKFFKALQKQPQEYLREKCRCLKTDRSRWRTKPVLGIWGNLTGFSSSFIPFFGLMQAAFFFYHRSELNGEQNLGTTYEFYTAAIGLGLGIGFTFFFQVIRWFADIGVFTGEQALIALIAMFLSEHSAPSTSVVAIFFQIAFLAVYLIYKFTYSRCVSKV